MNLAVLCGSLMHIYSVLLRLKFDLPMRLDSVLLDLSGEREALGPARLGVFPTFILST